MKYDDHAETCQQCRESPWNLCPIGRQALQADMDSIPPALQRQADLDAVLGKMLAMRWLEVPVGREKQPHILVHALAFTLAHLLMTVEGQPTIQELNTGEVIVNEHRLALFGMEVRAHVKELQNERLKAMLEETSFRHPEDPDDDDEEP